MGRSRSRSPERKRIRSPERASRHSPDREAKRRRESSKERREDWARDDRNRDDRRDRAKEDRRDREDVLRDDRRDRKDRERDRERDKERDRDKAGRDKDKDRDKERHREKEKDKEKRRSRSRERERRHSKSPGAKAKREETEEGELLEEPRHPAGPEDAAQPEVILEVKSENNTSSNPSQPSAKNLGGGMSRPKAEPLSLEELLKKRKQLQEELAKPKFLTKEERAKLALEKRAAAVAAQRQEQDALRAGLAAVAGATVQLPLPPPPPKPDTRENGHDRDKGRDDTGTAPVSHREREKELELIKQQYLGGEKQKKKILKPSDKFKFNFDWDTKDDTSKDLNPLYSNTHEAALMFGRGMRAGIDRREQKKLAAQLEKEVLAKARAAAGIADSKETRAQDRERERLANTYDGFDMRVDKHWSEKKLEEMTERDWRIFREDFNIAYRGANTSVLPLRTWEEANLPRPIMKAIEKVGYKKPSPIQRAAIPLGLQQRDVIGVAETGSGKTAAFVIPMLVYIMKQPPMTEANEADGPYAVVLAPTRELAQQIEEETLKLAQYTSYRVTSVVGGQSIEEQGSKLRRGCEIVVATPGRLIDCIERHYAVLNQCNYVVLDEADRMIDLGFEPQVMGVLDAMPSSNLKPENEEETLDANKVYRTTYMFSATMPVAVERLARKYLRRPVVVTIGTAGKATDNVTQQVYMVKENEKANRLQREIQMVGDRRAIVFVNTKRQCDHVYSNLEQQGHSCAILHGGKDQNQREAGIKGFRDGTYNVLIATDVAGRGIDVPDVALVVNYDMPNNIEAYTHRIGRTGRAGKKGTAVTFITGGDADIFYDLKKFLEDSKQAVPAELARHEAAKAKPGDAKPKRAETLYAA